MQEGRTSAPIPAHICNLHVRIFQREQAFQVYLVGLYRGSLPSLRCRCSSCSLWRSFSVLCAAVLSGRSSSWLLTLADRLSVSLNTLQGKRVVCFFCFFVFSNQNPWLTTLLFQPRLCGEHWNKSVRKRWKPAFCLNLACLQSKPSQNSNVNQSLISTVPPLLQLTFL